MPRVILTRKNSHSTWVMLSLSRLTISSLCLFFLMTFSSDCPVFESANVLKLILPKGYDFNIYDYGMAIPFSIYNEDDSAFDGTSYAGYVEITDEAGNRIIEEIQTTLISSAGLGSFSFTVSALPTV